MIFALEKNQFIIERQSNKEQQCVGVSDLCKQRLLGYAESFQELARSFGEEFSSVEGDRQRFLEEWKLWENRQIISNNLSEVARLMTQIANCEIWYQPMENKKKRTVVQALRGEGILVENIYYLPNDQKRMTIGMTLQTEKKEGVPAQEVADMLSVLLDKRLQISVVSPYLVDLTKRSFVFMEEAHFIALTGFSKAVKENENLSGDNYAIVESEKGKMTLLLSDGTGSGERASEDSERVLNLMEKMLEAGFGLTAAVKLVNTALFARGEESNHPTLDICSLDLYQGSCEFCKIGGAASFLKREQKVEQISIGNLPLGIFQNIQVNTLCRQLQDGDYLILMTDGVLDALEESDSEDIMAETIKGLTERNPQEIAEKLMQLVIRSCGGHILDDMSILVIGVWES